MSLNDLQLQFPQLLNIPFCTTAAEAEQRADEVAFELGLFTRTARWESGGSTRNVRYTDRENQVQLSVSITGSNVMGKQASWSFTCCAERTDVGLTLAAPRRIRVSSFRKDAEELVSRLRSLQVLSKGRLIGELSKWDKTKRHGYLQCAPGVRLFVSMDDIAPTERPHVHFKSWFSFQVQQTPKGQRAVNARHCPQWVTAEAANRKLQREASRVRLHER
ncbi:MAG: hypothetical protein JOY54_07520 [Acidobacteriaceae bacterium]|nr:hypothetical protein [Acidobacteriaceae bacterium]